MVLPPVPAENTGTLYRAPALNMARLLFSNVAARGFRNEPIFIEFSGLQAAVPDASCCGGQIIERLRAQRPRNRAYVNDRRIQRSSFSHIILVAVVGVKACGGPHVSLALSTRLLVCAVYVLADTDRRAYSRQAQHVDSSTKRRRPPTCSLLKSDKCLSRSSFRPMGTPQPLRPG